MIQFQSSSLSSESGPKVINVAAKGAVAV